MLIKRLSAGLALLVLSATLLTGLGCATKGQTGALAGSGVGALVGQIVGRNTAGTLIGAGVGAGIGYLIGNDMDKQDAKRIEAGQAQVQTAPLGGTRWRVVRMTPMPQPPFASYTVEFTQDGWLRSTETFADGATKNDSERYRVKGETLIINKPGYIINAHYSLRGDRLTIRSDRFTAEMRRLG